MSRTAYDLTDDFGAEDKAVLDSIFGDEETWERDYLYSLDGDFYDDDDDDLDDESPRLDEEYYGLTSYDLFGPDE